MDSEEDILQQDYMRARDSRAYPSTDEIVHWQEERQKGKVARAIGVRPMLTVALYSILTIIRIGRAAFEDTSRI